MSAVLSPVFGAGTQFFTNQGVVLAGGKLYTYVAGTTTPQQTWTASTQLVSNANPIILDSAGRLSNQVWITNGTTVKFVLTDSVGNTLGTWDNIPGVNSSTATFSEWLTGLTPTYISASSFSVPGNNVAIYQPLRRIQYSVVSGTYYGTISTSVYNGSTLTTVTFAADSTGMDGTLTAVNYGFLSAVNASLPATVLLSVSPVMTGTPIAPTAPVGTDTTQVATTAFAMHLQDPAFTGTPTAPTAAAATNSTQIATTAYVTTNITASATTAGTVPVWVSGSSYSLGNAVYSPISFQTYRRKIAGAGTTDPAYDSVNWTQLGGSALALVVALSNTAGYL